MKNAGLALCLLLCACADQPSQSGPTVTVLRQTRGSCYELLAGPPPTAGMGAKPCTNAITGNTKLAAGIDSIQLVIDYGTLDVHASATIPMPMPAVYVDGVATSPTPIVQAQPRLMGHTYFLATFTAPETISSNVTILVPVVTGYSAAVATTFQTVDPDITATVLARTSAGCYTPATDAVPSGDLGIADMCETPTVVQLNAGLDAIRVVVDYGILDIADTSAIPKPIVSLEVDGVIQSGGINADTVHMTGEGRRYFTGVAHVPSTPSSDVRIAVKPLPTSPSATEVRLSTVAPTPAVSILECPAPPAECEATAGVGTLHLVAALPGDVSKVVALHSFIDGAIQADPPAITTALLGSHTEGMRAIDVPAGVAEGAIWTLRAQLEAQYTDVSIKLHVPTISASLPTCAAPYTITTGEPLALKVVAPKDIHDRKAFYTTKLSGLPFSGGNLDLSTIDFTNKTIAGETTITAPLMPGIWTIDVSVSGYAAATLTVAVSAPSP